MVLDWLRMPTILPHVTTMDAPYLINVPLDMSWSMVISTGHVQLMCSHLWVIGVVFHLYASVSSFSFVCDKDYKCVIPVISLTEAQGAYTRAQERAILEFGFVKWIMAMSQ